MPDPSVCPKCGSELWCDKDGYRWWKCGTKQLFTANGLEGPVQERHGCLQRQVAMLRSALADADTDPDQILAMAGPHWVDEETKRVISTLKAERDEARLRLLSAAGDDLCRLSQDEIKELSSGAVKIPPKEEFLASCERFHQQIADGPGVLSNCFTLAQLIAENEKLRERVERVERERAEETIRADSNFEAWGRVMTQLTDVRAESTTLRSTLKRIAGARRFINGMVIDPCAEHLCYAKETADVAQAVLTPMEKPDGRTRA